jgi:membrane-associated phospholipid phosphatase
VPVPDRALGLRLAVAAVLAIVLLVPLSLLAVLVVGNWPPLHSVDLDITDALHSFAVGHTAWVYAMAAWSYLCDPNVMRVAALVLAVWLWRGKDAPRLAWWVVVTMTVGGVLAAVVKLLVGRHRPEMLEPVARAAGYSFPSGHALNTALAAGVFLLVLLPFVHDRRRLRGLLWTMVILIPLITGVCRVGLGVHWTSDVLAGWLMGIAVVAATAAAFAAWRERSGRRRVKVTDEGVEPEVAQQA